MHPTTLKLRDKLMSPSVPVEEKVALLHNAYAGETCFILACGPSLAEYKSEELSTLLKGKLVLCIKQALDFVEEEGDFLLLNSWNFRKYDFAKGRPIVVRESGMADPPVYLAGDIEMKIPKPSSRDDQLALSKKFDDYTFSKKIERPWGPGVLYELGFYLAEHMGCTKVVTLGWDVGVKNSPQMPHFYDTTSSDTVRLIRQSREIEDLAERNKFLHDNGVVYNRPRIIPEEVDDCAAVSGDWATWLTGKGIELKVVSKLSLAADFIPRTRIEAEV
ncbi:hypothetical protein RQ846_18930 [Roseomonas mucosa]|uniref:hypothetical protein n=1 Tax=Roseomonas mucosa TaxID=207340 RepID=UPI0028CC83A9|nr:hypothetical protein [Roseomonas mucosa]MDT8291791.1 hypothetical protein [Roseomonas mucosa]